MTVVPEALDRESRLDTVRRFLVDNPVIVLVGVLVLLFVLTDLVNRHEAGEPFVTWNQLSTTFLVARPMRYSAAGRPVTPISPAPRHSITSRSAVLAGVTATW